MERNSDEAHRLLFGIQRSARYHDRRRAFFDLLHHITNVVTILLSGVVLMDLAGTSVPDSFKASAAIAAILSAFDLVIGFSRRAAEHRDFKRQFIELERKMLSARSSEDFESIVSARLAVEADEPAVFRALDGLCHNELMIAHGHSQTDPVDAAHFANIPLPVRWTANLFKWSNVAVFSKPKAQRKR